MPEIIYIDENGSRVDKNSTNISYTDYIFRLRDDILYQNHPAFLRENWNLKDDIDSIYSLKLSTRRLMASDYIYAIKRMALRDNSSPILDIMDDYIVGLGWTTQRMGIQKLFKKNRRIIRNPKGGFIIILPRGLKALIRIGFPPISSKLRNLRGRINPTNFLNYLGLNLIGNFLLAPNFQWEGQEGKVP